MAKRKRESISFLGESSGIEMDSTLGLLQELAAEARIPGPQQLVHKDECIYSFDSPNSENGLYVSLTSFDGVGHDFLELYHQKTKNRLYLQISKRPVPKEPSDEAAKTDGDPCPPKKKPTVVAIGVEGGFNVAEEKVVYKESLKLTIMPERQTIDFGNVKSEIFTSFPLAVQMSIIGIQDAPTAGRQHDVAAWMADPRVVSKYAESLKQLDNGVKVPPKGWKCCKCDLTDNLWMNLTDGAILCGRRYFDGTGGNNHAVDHYNETKHPLAVKLGTITTEGGDVYSYDEDDMVLDPKLAEHLAHFGINIASLEKTDKTMAELEVDLNLKFEWDIITEADSKLQPLFGAGHTGLENLGNTCYLNSTMQVLFSIPAFRDRYYPSRPIMETCQDPTSDFEAQMSKLADGLLSGRYSRSAVDDVVGPDGVEISSLSEEDKQKLIERGQKGIAPRAFKSHVGRGHQEFSSNRQQDAQEFFLHMLNLIDRDSVKHPEKANPINCFKFQVEERLRCEQSGTVCYSTHDETILGVPVPLDAAHNKEELQAFEEVKAALEAKGEKVNSKDVVQPKISFNACLAVMSSPEVIDDFFSPATESKGQATKTTRFRTFPDYLVVQAKRFYLDSTWVPKKLDALLEVPDVLDLSHLRATGLQADEKEMPSSKGKPTAAAEPAFELDESIVVQLASMGFNVEGCKRAVFNTKNSGIDSAMNWVLEHMGDPDFNTPFQLPTPQAAAPASVDEPEPSAELIESVMAMGFERFQAVKALKATSNNLERAVDWIFSHPDELAEPGPAAAAPTAGTGSGAESGVPAGMTDGEGRYQLVAFISHMGTSSLCGHYVCHILKDGKWVIYNDSKVAVSEKPPRERAYLYLYRRM